MSPALQFLRTGSYSEGRRKIVLSLPKTSSAHDHPLPEQLIGNVETANQGVLNRKSGSAKRSRRREEIWSWLANSLRWFARPGEDNRKPQSPRTDETSLTRPP